MQLADDSIQPSNAMVAMRICKPQPQALYLVHSGNHGSFARFCNVQRRSTLSLSLSAVCAIRKQIAAAAATTGTLAHILSILLCKHRVNNNKTCIGMKKIVLLRKAYMQFDDFFFFCIRIYSTKIFPSNTRQTLDFP